MRPAFSFPMNLSLPSHHLPPVAAPAAATDTAERLRALFDGEYDFVWRSARRLGLQPADADDAAQAVFVIVSRKLECIEPGKERGFLFGTTTRVVSDIRRSAAHRYEVPTDNQDHVRATGALPDEQIAQHQLRAELDRLVSELPMNLRAVFVLHELEGLPMREIAILVELPSGTVASRLRKARELFEAGLQRAKARLTSESRAILASELPIAGRSA
jgi:RNA polymerase sigma-70 factor, ECF subfamily